MGEFGKYEVHPVAALFPLIVGEEFDRLVADIKANGLIEPITLAWDGARLIDGRNRYRACEAAGVDPRYIKLGKHYGEIDLVQFIISKNLKRRHLDTGQRAMLAVGLLPYFEAEAKERQRAGGKEGGRGRPKEKGHNIANDILDAVETATSEWTRQKKGKVRPKSGEPMPRAADQAAAAVNVGHSAVSQAKKVADASSRLAGEVRAGNVALNDAYKQVRRNEKNADSKEPAATDATMLLKNHLGEDVSYHLPKGKSKFNKTNQQVSWATWTWNPVTGCLHGCRYCYARELSARNSYSELYPAGFTPLFHHERLDAPKNTLVPDEAKNDPALKRVFVCSMADLYGKWVPDEWIERVHASCIANPQWEYLFLTKFPRRYVGLQLPTTAWLGTSVDEQKRVRLAEEAFRQIRDVRVKWLSLEPLLAPLEFSDLSMFDWIVIGSQSATDQPDGVGHVPAFAPPFEWVAKLTAQAHEAGCKVFQKPNLIGVPNPQCAGMKLIQEAPFLTNGQHSKAQAELTLDSIR